MQSIFAAILPSPLVGAGTLITRWLDVKGRDRGIHLATEVNHIEFHRFENIIRAEPAKLARQTSRKDSEIAASLG